MLEFIVILQEPKHEGNIGAVARCMKNFGFSKLFLVNPPELSDICFQRAKHAQEVIQGSERFESLSAATKEIDFLVGTTGIVNLNDKHHIRNPITPREFVTYAQRLKLRVGLLFGREDYGLYDEELLECDLLLSIPTNKEYPIMNLSHAVAVVLYELASAELKFNIKGRKSANDFERDKLYEQFKEFLETFDYPKQKRENTEILFRRLIGRATPSKWEFYTMMGVYGRASKKMNRERKEKSKDQDKKIEEKKTG